MMNYELKETTKLYKNKNTNEIYLFDCIHSKFSPPFYDYIGIPCKLLKNPNKYVKKNSILTHFITFTGNDLYLFHRRFRSVKNNELLKEMINLKNCFQISFNPFRKDN